MIKNIILVRHGESEGNINRKAYEERPDYAIRLTHKGAEQARNAGKRIAEVEGNFHILLSPYFRTRQTFEYAKEPIGEERIKSVSESVFLREQEWNNGIPRAFDSKGEDGRDSVGTMFYRFDGAESGADVYLRMMVFHKFFVEPLLNKLDGNLVIVLHGYSLRVYVKVLKDLSVEDFEMMRNPKNGEVFVVKVDQNADGEFEFDILNPFNIRPKRVSKFHYDKYDLAQNRKEQND